MSEQVDDNDIDFLTSYARNAYRCISRLLYRRHWQQILHIEPQAQTLVFLLDQYFDGGWILDYLAPWRQLTFVLLSLIGVQSHVSFR